MADQTVVANNQETKDGNLADPKSVESSSSTLLVARPIPTESSREGTKLLNETASTKPPKGRPAPDDPSQYSKMVTDKPKSRFTVTPADGEAQQPKQVIDQQRRGRFTVQPVRKLTEEEMQQPKQPQPQSSRFTVTPQRAISSASSSNAGSESGKGPVASSATDEKSPAPGDSPTIPTADSASVGSQPSTADSTSQAGDLKSLQMPPNPSMHSQQQQQLQQPHNRVVAMPLQQSRLNDEMEQRQLASQNGNFQPQTVYYQIPGIVLLPVEAGVPQQQERTIMTREQLLPQPIPVGLQQPNFSLQPQHHQQQPLQPQSVPDHIIGTTTTATIQDGAVELVKKKKGRFNLSQESHIANQQGNQVLNHHPHAPIPNSIALPGGVVGQSSSSNVSQLTNQVSAPRTFDGTSAPTVKKKGRFVVTNVKEPELISIPITTTSNIQHQGQTPAQHAMLNMGGKQSTQPLHNHQQHIQQHQVNQNLQLQQHRHNQQQMYLAQNEKSMSSLYSNYETQQSMPQQTLPYKNQQVAPPPPARSSSNQNMSGQYQTNQVQYHNGQRVQPSQTQASQEAPQQVYYVAAPEQGQGMSGSQMATPTATPGSLPDSPWRGPPMSPQSLKPTEKPKASNGTPKKNLVQRVTLTNKVPQTFDSKGTWSSVGLGKAFYFLDQMKIEVTDADRVIKNLQTDMKFLVRLVDAVFCSLFSQVSMSRLIYSSCCRERRTKNGKRRTENWRKV
jgi:hypothetical protein